MSARTMEIFRQWGIEDDITAAGLPRNETEYFFLGETGPIWTHPNAEPHRTVDLRARSR